MDKTLSEELNEMAADVEKKREAKIMPKFSIKRFFSRFDWLEALMSVTIVCVIGSVVGPAIYKYKTKANKSVASGHQKEYNDNDKHWANVLVLIHERDAKRAAEIITKVDKPHRLLDEKLESYEDKYKSKTYLITHELEEILKSHSVRYQRNEYNDSDSIYNLLHLRHVGSHIRLYVEPSPWINW